MKRGGGQGGAVRRPGVRQRLAWRWGFALLVLALLLFYLLSVLTWSGHPGGGLRPGSNLGVALGIAATALLLATALYGLRRRAMGLATRLHLGRAQTWLRLHVYGGGVFLLLMLMHSGFHLPSGTLSWSLWLLSLWLVLSGLGGLLLQTWLPRVLSSGLRTEVNYERIPELVGELGRRAEEVAAACGEPVRIFYGRTLAPALSAPHWDVAFLLGITAASRARLEALHSLHSLSPAEDRPRIEELADVYRTKVEVDVHYTLQRVLRGWLYAHVPPALLLLALVALHIFTVTYY